MSTNTSVVTEFILIGFSHLAELQSLIFSFFLTVYLLTVVGNLLIVVLVSADAALQTPLYFFLRNLSALEIGYTSVTNPLLLHHLLTGQRHSPRSGCALQMPWSVASWQPWPVTAMQPSANSFASPCC